MLSFKSFLTLLEDREDFLSNKYGMDKNTIGKISRADPSPKKEYTEWLTRMHKKQQFGDPDNNTHIEHHRELLNHFHNIKTSMKSNMSDNNHSPDINSYKTPEHLSSVVNHYVGKKIFDENGIKAHVIQNPEEAEYHGIGSKWCTKTPGSHIDSYLKHGSLVALHTTDPKEKYQWFTPEDSEKEPELKNIDNHSIEHHELESIHPIIKKMPAWQHHKEIFANHNFSDADGDEHDHEHAHELSHSEHPEDREESVFRYHAHENMPELYDDPHPSVRRAIIDVETGKGSMQRDRVHRHFIDDPDEDIRSHIAEHSHSRAVMHDMYNEHVKGNDDSEVAYGLASNPRIPHFMVKELANHDNHYVRAKVAENPKSIHTSDINPSYSSEIHHSILNHKENVPSAYSSIAEHTTSSSRGDHTLLDRMANHPDEHARAAVAHYAPEKYLDKLKNDRSYLVNQNLARHYPEKYYNHPNSSVRHSAVYAANDENAEEIFKHSINDSEPLIRASTLRRSSNEEHNIKLMNDDDESVKDQIKSNMEKVSHGTHLAMLQSKHPEIKSAVARHMKSSPELFKLKNDPNEYIRSSVVRNINLPKEHVEQMAENDPSDLVKMTARNRLSYMR